MTTYMIDDEHGNWLRNAGDDHDRARVTAQACADERGAPVGLYEHGKGDACETFQPAVVLRTAPLPKTPPPVTHKAPLAELRALGFKPFAVWSHAGDGYLEIPTIWAADGPAALRQMAATRDRGAKLVDRHGRKASQRTRELNVRWSAGGETGLLRADEQPWPDEPAGTVEHGGFTPAALDRVNRLLAEPLPAPTPVVIRGGAAAAPASERVKTWKAQTSVRGVELTINGKPYWTDAGAAFAFDIARAAGGWNPPAVETAPPAAEPCDDCGGPVVEGACLDCGPGAPVLPVARPGLTGAALAAELASRPPLHQVTALTTAVGRRHSLTIADMVTCTVRIPRDAASTNLGQSVVYRLAAALAAHAGPEVIEVSMAAHGAADPAERGTVTLLHGTREDEVRRARDIMAQAVTATLVTTFGPGGV